MILLLGLIAISGMITGAIASSKGRDFFPWFLFGCLLAIVAIPCALLLQPDQATADRRALEGGAARKCPHCAEIIRLEANVCRFCGRDVAAPDLVIHLA